MVLRAVEAGELRSDPDLAVAQLLGPLVFRRMITSGPLDRPVVDALVDGFLRANRVPPQR